MTPGRQTIVAAAVLLAATTVAATAAPLNRLEQRGYNLLKELCSRCHAVGRSGASPHVGAPTFRTIANRYDIDDLVERLRDGFTAPHPDMPTFSFTRQDAEAVRAYLNAIQE